MKAQKKGNHQECMRCLCRAIEILFSQRIDLIVSLVSSQHPLSDIGLRLLRTEPGARVEMTRAEYGQSDCHAALAYCEKLRHLLFGEPMADRRRTADTGRIPRRTFAELMVLQISHLSRRCLQSAQGIEAKRWQLQCLLKLRMLFLRGVPLYREQNRILSGLLGLLLHEPEKHMTQLINCYYFYFEFNYAKRLLHLESNRESDQYLHAFHWPSQRIYQKLIDTNNSSRVLVSIHMGDFAGAFRVISALAHAERRAISLRREMETEDDINLRFLNRMQHRVFRHGQNNSVAIVNALRKGNHTLAVLFDLKGEFGETLEVQFFGRSANFVKGPAQLAVAGKAALLPFVTYEENGVNCIVMEPIISSDLLDGENFPTAVKRITQQLVDLAERWIKRNPAQWKYLTSLPGYFSNSAEKAAAGHTAAAVK